MISQQVRTTQETITFAQSSKLMKNLFRTAISNIVYLRGFFAGSAFADHTVGGLHIKLLLAKEDESKTLHDWIEKGVFDAFEKQYLSEVIFGVYSEKDDSSNLIESYNFRVRYGDELIFSCGLNGQSEDVGIPHKFTKAQVQKSFNDLLRSIVLQTSMMGKLPDDRYLTIKLIYNKNAPDDYEPPFFRAASNTLQFKKKPEQINVGKVRTEFHAIEMNIFMTETDCVNSSSSTETKESPQELVNEIMNEDSEVMAEKNTETKIDIEQSYTETSQQSAETFEFTKTILISVIEALACRKKVTKKWFVDTFNISEEGTDKIIQVLIAKQFLTHMRGGYKVETETVLRSLKFIPKKRQIEHESEENQNDEPTNGEKSEAKISIPLQPIKHVSKRRKVK